MDKEWSAEDEAKWQEEDDNTCYFCDTVNGHDCDCKFSPYPKCEECNTSYTATVGCVCGKHKAAATDHDKEA